MASDITLAVGDGVRRMTYAELADMRRISVASAERIVRRKRWVRTTGNDGIVRVLVPLEEARKPPKRTKRVSVSGQRTSPPDSDVVRDTVRTLELAVSALSGQLDHERASTIRERERAERAEQRADRAEARISDAEAAERIARDEAAGLRAELDARKQWSLWRRVRGR